MKHSIVRVSPYLDLHLKIDNEGRFRTKLYDNRNDFRFYVATFKPIIVYTRI